MREVLLGVLVLNLPGGDSERCAAVRCRAAVQGGPTAAWMELFPFNLGQNSAGRFSFSLFFSDVFIMAFW